MAEKGVLPPTSGATPRAPNSAMSAFIGLGGQAALNPSKPLCRGRSLARRRARPLIPAPFGGANTRNGGGPGHRSRISGRCAEITGSAACPYRKSDPDILMMQSPRWGFATIGRRLELRAESALLCPATDASEPRCNMLYSMTAVAEGDARQVRRHGRAPLA
jgi:hypothetical protein